MLPTTSTCTAELKPNEMSPRRMDQPSGYATIWASAGKSQSRASNSDSGNASSRERSGL